MFLVRGEVLQAQSSLFTQTCPSEDFFYQQNGWKSISLFWFPSQVQTLSISGKTQTCINHRVELVFPTSFLTRRPTKTRLLGGYAHVWFTVHVVIISVNVWETF